MNTIHIAVDNVLVCQFLWFKWFITLRKRCIKKQKHQQLFVNPALFSFKMLEYMHFCFKHCLFLKNASSTLLVSKFAWMGFFHLIFILTERCELANLCSIHTCEHADVQIQLCLGAKTHLHLDENTRTTAESPLFLSAEKWLSPLCCCAFAHFK